ncbi:hypothetical protein HYY73_05275 [Candidatus Woesearchaeota archaeon]|nr:hypothetical protein [Candidatus Woesearchaeota archaeon]
MSLDTELAQKLETGIRDVAEEYLLRLAVYFSAQQPGSKDEALPSMRELDAAVGWQKMTNALIYNEMLIEPAALREWLADLARRLYREDTYQVRGLEIYRSGLQLLIEQHLRNEINLYAAGQELHAKREQKR